MKAVSVGRTLSSGEPYHSDTDFPHQQPGNETDSLLERNINRMHASFNTTQIWGRSVPVLEKTSLYKSQSGMCNKGHAFNKILSFTLSNQHFIGWSHGESEKTGWFKPMRQVYFCSSTSLCADLCWMSQGCSKRSCHCSPFEKPSLAPLSPCVTSDENHDWSSVGILKGHQLGVHGNACSSPFCMRASTGVLNPSSI